MSSIINSAYQIIKEQTKINNWLINEYSVIKMISKDVSNTVKSNEELDRINSLR